MNVETRTDELTRLCGELDETVRGIVMPLISHIAFIEMQLETLKQYPFISINPKNPALQRQTAAAKQYKEFLQQYNNCIKIMLSALGKVEAGEESPLRQYLESMKKKWSEQP